MGASSQEDRPHRKSLWNDVEAAQFSGDLGLRVYTSRLLGRDPSLVLHGGGNSSVKLAERNLVGEEETILYVKGSGGDLARIEESGFSPVRMAYLLALWRAAPVIPGAAPRGGEREGPGPYGQRGVPPAER